MTNDSAEGVVSAAMESIGACYGGLGVLFLHRMVVRVFGVFENLNIDFVDYFGRLFVYYAMV